MKRSLLSLAAGLWLAAPASADDLRPRVDAAARGLEPRVIEWRRDLHQHPELSNREFRTGALVGDHLEALGLEVRREVAHTGVVGVLRGGRPGPVVALRADMDALPVTEATGLPFASKVRTSYLGREVGVMHACGHDGHTAVLMGVAELLAGLRAELRGSVVFLFQPAEEKPPPGEEGGARLMLKEGAFDDPRPEVIFGLHVTHRQPVGTIAVTPGGAMASSDNLKILVRGSQTHAAYPWRGVDPIAVASRIVLALHAIPARQVDTRIPSVVSIGAIHGGVRSNIIPAEVEMLGTIRALDRDMRFELHEKVKRSIAGIAASAGAEANVDIVLGYPITYNNPALLQRMRPTLDRVSDRSVVESLPVTGAEDFAFYQEQIPGLYFWVGVRSPDVAFADAAPNHSPGFFLDERGLELGIRALAHLALDYMQGETD